jgi:ankyrin repeat protein
VSLVYQEAELDDSETHIKSSDQALSSVQCLTLLALQYGRTSLYAASENGKLPVVQFLVERGAKLEATDWVYFTLNHPHTS